MIAAIRQRRVAGLLAFLSLASGCQMLRDTRPIVVEARDAETRQPIAGAEVSLAYPLPPPGQPQEVAASAGPDGVARLQGSVPGAGGLMLAVRAKGYHSEKQNVASETVQAIPALKMFEKSDQRPVRIVVDLFADPDPAVELVLPAGYKGLIKAEVVVRPDAPFTPGQRAFAVDVTPAGTAQLVGPPILEHAFGPDFRFRYADNTPLSRRAEESEIGYWWLNCDDKTEIFLVGTLLDFDTYRRTHRLQDGVGGNRQGGAVSRGGHHGRHRNGNNMPSPDSSSTGS